MNDVQSKTFSRARAGGDVEVGVERRAVDSDGHMSSFFDEVGVINNKMYVTRQLLVKMQNANEGGKTVTKAAAMKALRDRMDQDVREVTKAAKSIKDKLEQLDKANIDSRKTKSCQEGSPTDRTRMAITNGLPKKLTDLMQEFTGLRDKITGEYKETIERRYFTVTGDKPDTRTLDRIIETGESETFFLKAIQEQGRGQVIETVREIQERHDGVKEIEKSCIELDQIFLDMAVLVEAQRDQLNDVEANFIRDFRPDCILMQTSTQLHIAKRHQRNTRKWVCIWMILLLILIAIIVFTYVEVDGCDIELHAAILSTIFGVI